METSRRVVKRSLIANKPQILVHAIPLVTRSQIPDIPPSLFLPTTTLTRQLILFSHYLSNVTCVSRISLTIVNIWIGVVFVIAAAASLGQVAGKVRACGAYGNCTNYNNYCRPNGQSTALFHFGGRKTKHHFSSVTSPFVIGEPRFTGSPSPLVVY